MIQTIRIWRVKHNNTECPGYPTVGGEWIVQFNATGTADLYISASNGTEWSNTNQNYDLMFVELKCGATVMGYTWIDNGAQNSSVFIPNYNCSEISTERSKVITPGKHILRFEFGEGIAYANNFASFFVDTSNADFGDGIMHQTNLSGFGATANVTLNFTFLPGNMSGGIKKYTNFSGNFTSRIFNSTVNQTAYDKISWSRSLPNSSDVIGYATHGPADMAAVFYRNGSFGTDETAASYGAALDFTTALRRYTIPPDTSYSDILGLGFDGDSDVAYAFFQNGSTAADTSQADLTSDIDFLNGLNTWTIPPGFNVSNIIGFAIDTDNTGAAVFFNNGTFIEAAQEAAPFKFTTARVYTIPAGFNFKDMTGVDYHSGGNDITSFFKNVSRLSDNSQTGFTTDIAFATYFGTTYHAGFNITAYTNVTLYTRVSNNSITFTPWSTAYLNNSGIQGLTDDIGMYVQYRAVFKTPDPYVSPELENVTINYIRY